MVSRIARDRETSHRPALLRRAGAQVYTCPVVHRRSHAWLYAALLVGAAAPAMASGAAAHTDPVASVVLALAVILGAAKIGG